MRMMPKTVLTSLLCEHRHEHMKWFGVIIPRLPSWGGGYRNAPCLSVRLSVRPDEFVQAISQLLFTVGG